MIQLYQDLDMRPIGIPQTLRLSQYDSDFQIVFSLTNFDGTWTVDNNTTAEVQGTKTDGHGYSADAVFDSTNLTVTIAGDVQMTAAAGRNVFEVVLFHGGDRLGSKNFILDVERAALDAETTASDSKIKNFTAMVEAAEDAAETATAAAEEAVEAASTFSTDPTLTIAGKAADALSVGEQLRNIQPGLSSEAVDALLTCFRHVAWIDGQGQTYYDALEDALNPVVLSSITAVFAQGQHVVYDTDSLSSLRPYLTVTANYSDGSTAVVTDYALTGTLTVGVSTVTAIYGGKVATFSVTVTHNAVLLSISAVFTQGDAVIYDDDALDTLRQYLVVTAHYDDGTDSAVSNYVLSGTLAEGTSTITASYGGQTDTFSVTVAAVTHIVPTVSDSAVVGVGDTIESLRTSMTVYAHYDAGTTRTVTDYTLPSGTLASGANAITVTYKSATCDVYVYAPSSNADSLAYKIPDNTELTGAVMDTGVKLHDSLKDFTILVKITDKNGVVPTSGQDESYFYSNYITTTSGPIGSRLTIKAQSDSDVTKKKYAEGFGTNVTSGLYSDGNHEVIAVARLKFNNDFSQAERTVSLFVDGTKISTEKANVARTYLDRPTDAAVGIGLRYGGTGISEAHKAFTGTVKLFEIYKRALTDTEVNTKLGVTI